MTFVESKQNQQITIKKENWKMLAIGNHLIWSRQVARSFLWKLFQREEIWITNRSLWGAMKDNLADGVMWVVSDVSSEWCKWPWEFFFFFLSTKNSLKPNCSSFFNTVREVVRMLCAFSGPHERLAQRWNLPFNRYSQHLITKPGGKITKHEAVSWRLAGEHGVFTWRTKTSWCFQEESREGECWDDELTNYSAPASENSCLYIPM